MSLVFIESLSDQVGYQHDRGKRDLCVMTKEGREREKGSAM